MLPYTIEELPEESIIILTLHADFSVAAHQDQSILELHKLLDAQPNPVIFIQDIRLLTITFSELIELATRLTRTPAALFHHPKIARLISVTTDKAMRLTYKGLRSEVFRRSESRLWIRWKKPGFSARKEIGGILRANFIGHYIQISYVHTSHSF